MRNRNYYSWLWLFVSTFFLLASCEKDDLIEPMDENENIVHEKQTKCRPNNGLRAKTFMLTKKVWTYGKVFHEDPAIQDVLEGVFTDLKFKFNRNGSYHIVIPAIGRDDIGTWEFMDKGSKILFDKGTDGEHHITILSLKFWRFFYTFDDPALGPWKLQLVRKHHEYDD